MKHDEAIKLMELMARIGFSKQVILLTLVECEEGHGIGHALLRAIELINRPKEEKK